ncbi:phospho-sugar mutase [Halothermothrix orenii]|uniref:Phosphoglucomutase n=1 Tax=Halothermothrix orenii (strain H 168 / OCM 544 / DSM 9562) TaxID=373903 RepID=B8CYX1_HALOH|nr:alpha-phosphoglucomutase [Halothermothrix orenii H 168]
MNYMSRYKEWLLSDYFDEETKAELESIKDDKKEIEDRFYKDLNFGTGGLRGIIGAGTNRMNKYTVQKATQGLANYIINYSENGKDRGVVIAYDSRHKSPEFALEAALVLNGNGIKAYLFDELRPTPELSFAVRDLNAIGGIVITASHNPPEYNGYKVYWEDGGQVVPDQAREIIAEIEEIDDFELVKRIDEKEARSQGLLKTIGEEIDKRYIEEMLKVLPNKELASKKGKDFSIIYTPLHGTGNKPVRRVLKELGFNNVHVVEEQAKPDPEFSTVESPNPEEFSAFKMALDLAGEYEPELIIGTDPDCDRMGIVVKNNEGEYVGLNGNQVGVLMADYLLSQMKEQGELPDNGVIIKTIVTTEMVRKVAADYGVEVMDVLTGFKFIGEKIKEFKKTGDHTFIFGFEESYGYLAGTYCRDKDAVIASALIATMALYYREQGFSIYEKLIDLMEKYGYYKEKLSAIKLEGKEGQDKIKNTLATIREDRPDSISGIKVEVFKDYKEKKSYNNKTGEIEDIDLPESNVLQFKLEDDSMLTIRPSGTEPKLKIYFAVRGENEEDAERKINALKENFLAEVNKIIDES